MNKREQEAFENLTGCVIANFTALYYNEKIKQTTHYKHNLKRLLNPVIKELIKIESKEFDKICETDEDSLSTLSEGNIDFIKEMSKGSFKTFMQNQNVIIANSIDEKRMTNLATKIIKEHNNKNI